MTKIKISKETNPHRTYSDVRGIRNRNECLFKCASCSSNGKRKVEKNHLIAKSYLSRIARNNQVLVFDFEKNDYIKANRMLQLRNISNANTFQVLCGYHDRSLFSEIENGNKFNVDNPKQLFQFALRAFVFAASESYINTQVDKHCDNISNRVADAHFQKFSYDLELYKKLEENQFWSEVEHTVIRLNKKCHFMSCYYGRPLIDWRFFPRFCPAKISFNIFPEQDETIVLLSFLKRENFANTARNFCRDLYFLSLTDEEKFIKYINKLITAFDHNIVISPEYWDTKTDFEKSEFYKLAHRFPKNKSMLHGLLILVRLHFLKFKFSLIS